jgi:hypothetical protein
VSVDANAAFLKWHGPTDKPACLPSHPHLSGMVQDAERAAYTAAWIARESELTTARATIDRLTAELEQVRAERDELEQTSGDLCEKCSWRGVRGQGCEFCELFDRKREAEDRDKDAATIEGIGKL